ncbi:cytochrome P450 [Nodosilinea nodulosa]|uniref:cytochrome P450 n=1 Tax=Nodosilinea nodulosa TaxID=416001 RepID=UPI0002ECA814|nr:cytochrome P450 [Nodosilinea nodulosa]
MNSIPHLPGLDSTVALLLDGYEFIGKRCDRLQSDIFQTRLLLEKTICMRGKAAAEVFYDTGKFSRQKAAPARAKKTLLGEGGVQGLDGDAHRQRKQIFMALMTPEHIDQLAERVHQYCLDYAQWWQRMDRVVLFDAIEEILCRAVCDWSGVPLGEAEVQQRTRHLSQMIAGSGRVGPTHWQARRARQQAEAWIEGLLGQVRSGAREVPEGTAMHSFAWHRSPAGNLLDSHDAAVDVLNVLRPTVAIGRYIVFAALALHQHPQCRLELQQGDSNYVHWFTQEVRRFYPFFPFAAACTRHDFEWNGYHFPAGVKVLLDLYGTNHHPDLWDQPEEFRPDRFRDWQENAYDFIPQGGGDYQNNHRCAGEWLTIRVMERVLAFLVGEIDYRVPPQNLDFSLSTLPPAPKSRFLIDSVRVKVPLDSRSSVESQG